jgi:hypothetical protein
LTARHAAGILLYGASTGTVVSGNTLTDDQIAVESVASDASITGNTISETGGGIPNSIGVCAVPCDTYRSLLSSLPAVTTVAISDNSIAGIPQSYTSNSNPTVVSAGIWVGNTAAASATASADLTVSSTGVVRTTGKLAAGTYSISGTDADVLGDGGSWSFTLTVTASAPTGGPPIVVKVVPPVTIAAVGPWTLYANKLVHFRIHLYGSRGKVSGVVRLVYGGRTLCARLLVNGVARCTVSSVKIGRGRHWLVVTYTGSGFYKARRFRVNVYVH